MHPHRCLAARHRWHNHRTFCGDCGGQSPQEVRIAHGDVRCPTYGRQPPFRGRRVAKTRPAGVISHRQALRLTHPPRQPTFKTWRLRRHLALALPLHRRRRLRRRICISRVPLAIVIRTLPPTAKPMPSSHRPYKRRLGTCRPTRMPFSSGSRWRQNPLAAPPRLRPAGSSARTPGGPQRRRAARWATPPQTTNSACHWRSRRRKRPKSTII